MEILIGIFSNNFWYIAPILVTLTTALSGVLNNMFNITKGWAKQVLSWIVGSGLSVAVWALELLVFGNPVWLGVVCLCMVVGLASNGFYDIPTIKNYVNSWFIKKSE